MAVEQQRTTGDELPELPEASAAAVCPWCCGPVVEISPRRDHGLFGHRYVSLALMCVDCDVVIRLDWPSAPHTRRPHG